jgi:trimeric autotransporter adhesin
MNPLIQLKKATPPFLFVFLLACFAFFPIAEAVVPPPDGGYPGANTAEGQQALLSLSGGTFNTALGWSSLKSNIAGNYNTGVGAGALVLNTSDQNTATGAGALLLNTSGFRNTANGAFALLHNNAADNTGIGNAALFSNTTGSGNTATGNFALIDNDTGSNNTATGNGALSANISGDTNTAIGAGALASNNVGHENTAVGFNALLSNTNGGDNTATGFSALVGNTGGSNTANGAYALAGNSGSANTAAGAGALFNNASGFGNTALGFDAGLNVSTANHVICIGAGGADVSNSTWINNIYNTTTVSGTTLPVIVSDGGQLGTTSSSRRFKRDIRAIDKASEAILALKPVTFHYKSDAEGTPQFGLIAEEVAEVNPDLVVRDKNGEIYTVRYDAVNAMLLNEFLKEHRTVQEQKATIAQLTRDSAKQQKQIERLIAGLQKVSHQLELSKTQPEMVVSNQ